MTMAAETPPIESNSSHHATLDPEERRRRLREIQLPLSRKVIKQADFEIAWPEKVSVIGFAVISLICVLIAFGTWLLGQWLGHL